MHGSELREKFDLAGKFSQAMKAAAPAADGVKGMTITFDATPGNDLKFGLNMMCKNGDDAIKIKAGAEEGWVLAKAGMAALPAQPGPGGEALRLMMEDLKSAAFKTQGDTATASVTFTNRTITELAKAAKNNPFGAGGFGPGPPPIPPQPPPVQPGPFPQPGKDFEPKKGPNRQGFAAANIQPGNFQEVVYRFDQGRKVFIEVNPKGLKGPPNASLSFGIEVLHGNAGENQVVLQKGGRGAYSFVVPATNSYRVRVRNQGKAVIQNITLDILDQ